MLKYRTIWCRFRAVSVSMELFRLNLQTEEQLKVSLIWSCFVFDVVLLEWKLLQS